MLKTIHNELELDQALSTPGEALIHDITAYSSPLVIVGAGGKMGPTLALMARRAAELAGYPLEVIAVSRFSDPKTAMALEHGGIRTISLDLINRESFQKLPPSDNIISLVGIKFGTASSPWLTWATNTLVPAYLSERYPSARIIALSTGNVYPLVTLSSGGATEETPLTPHGEYGNAAVARERIFEYFSHKNRTRLVLLRLNYAFELRYGVLVDIAQKVQDGTQLDLTQGYFNCIWQREANEYILRSINLSAAPAVAYNLTGPDILSVREVANRLAQLLGKAPSFTGSEAANALLSNPSNLLSKLGSHITHPFEFLPLIADWIKDGGRLLNKPTRFEVRDGRF